MEHIFKKVAPAPVTLIGPAPTAQMKYVLWTVAHMVFAWGELVAAKKAGRAPHVIREPATLAVPNTEPARMASANAARAGTESTVPSRVVPACATAMEGVRWTKTAGIVFASRGGEEPDAMWPWRLSAQIARTMKEMDSLTAWILIAVYRVPAKISPTAVDCLTLRTSLAKAYNHHLSKLPNPSMIESIFL